MTPQVQDGLPLPEYYLQKYLLLLATVVATVAYAAAFNPPGGAWQATQGHLGVDDHKGHLAGEPIIRSTHYLRFVVFFYCNAAAFALSIVVIILILVLVIWYDWETPTSGSRNGRESLFHGLRVAMVFDSLVLVGAYAAGTSQDEVTTKNDWVLAAVFFVVAVVHMVLWHCHLGNNPSDNEKSDRKVLMVLATFITSITYTSGLSLPGGFWDSSNGGHSAGDPILQGNHHYRLRAFFFCNTTSFAMSLLIIVLLMGKRILPSWKLLYPYIAFALLGLAGAYAFGSCRETDNTVYVVSLLAGAFILFLISWVIILRCYGRPIQNDNTLRSETVQAADPQQDRQEDRGATSSGENGEQRGNNDDADAAAAEDNKNVDRARSLVEQLAVLAATVTYQAGLVPPGGVWQDNQGGHKAGDPILLSTDPKRYKVFFYCNSMAFLVSLVVIISARFKSLFKGHALEMTMMLDLFGLMGAYAAGSCRDVSTSMVIVALVGAVLVYMVIHVGFFPFEEANDDKVVRKRRKMLLLLAVLGAAVTYQAGLAPPGGFQQSGSHLGDPVLLHNYPRRYNTFFYCNSVTFASSIALIIVLVSPNMYKSAIASYALHICTAVGMFGLVGALAAGSTQHLDTSFYIFVLVGVVLCVVVLLLLIYSCCKGPSSSPGETTGDPHDDVKPINMMMLGVLAASITYQAGLNPPGSVWQDNSGGHAAGDPVMHDNRRHRYTAFFYSNSASFVASVAFIILLLWDELQKNKRWLTVAKMTMMVLNLLGLLGAYAAGTI